MEPLSFDQVVRNRNAQPFFLQYLAAKHCANILLFYLEVEQFKELVGKSVEIKTQATKLADVHFGSQPCLSFVGQDEFDKVLKHIKLGKPTLDMFTGAQRAAGKRLRSEFGAFTRSPAFTGMMTELKLKPVIGTLHDTLRDNRRVRVLLEYLLVDRPSELDVLRFCLELRNKYGPAVAEALAPSDPNVPRHIMLNRKVGQAKKLIGMAKEIAHRYLRSESPNFANKVSSANAAKVIHDLDDWEKKVEQVEIAPLPPTTSATLTAASSARWTRPPAAPQNPSQSPIDDTIRGIAEVFRPAEEEAVNWLERVALVELARSDFYIPPQDAIPSRPPSAPLLLPSSFASISVPLSSNPNDVPVVTNAVLITHKLNADKAAERGEVNISVWRISPAERKMRDQSPHVAKPLARSFSKAAPTHLLRLDAVNVCNDEPVIDYTGPTVLDISRGCKFRSRIVARSQVEDIGSIPEPPPTSMVQGERTQSLAGVSSIEVAAINRARQRIVTGGYDPKTLASSDIHAHCFPLGLTVDVCPIESLADVEFSHAFVIPCKPMHHSSDVDCLCMYGLCVSRRVRRETDLCDFRTPPLSVSAAATLSTAVAVGSPKRSKAITSRAYSETTVSLSKVPRLGLGITMSLNRDGCVIVSRFLSEVGVPSPAAHSGKVAVDDELLSVNGVPVVGRRFDDIISQVKLATGAVALRFSRGYYVHSFCASGSFTSSAASGAAAAAAATAKRAAASNVEPMSMSATKKPPPSEDKLVESERSSSPPPTYTVRVTECVALLSPRPIFAEMKEALEDWGFGEGDDVRGAIGRVSLEVAKEDVAGVVFRTLSIPLVVDLVASLLLEKRVLLVSDDIGCIVPVFEGLRSLMWPFQYRHEWLPLISEARVDWFAQRVENAKPFFAGLCTVDLLPPSTSERPLPRRQGRVVLKEEAWSARERDSDWASERLMTPGCVRQGVAALFEAGKTIVVDLDADMVRSAPLESFPPDLRDGLIRQLNSALSRGGAGSGFGSATPVPPKDPDEGVRAAFHAVFAALVNRSEQYLVSPREDVMSFYKVEYLQSVFPAHKAFVEQFVDTETFAHFCKCGFEFPP